MKKNFAHLSYSAVSLLLLLVLPPVSAGAADAWQRIPENSLGFAVVQNLAQSSEKFEQLLDRIDAIFPEPLAFAKAVTGLESGLDVSGNLVIAILPGNEPEASTQPLVLLPIANYKKFASSIHADESGAICRITLLGEDILVAQSGTYAMLMNLEHRDSMEVLVAQTPKAVEALAPLAEWIAKQDIFLALLPTGIEALKNRQRRSARRPNIDDMPDEERSSLSQLLSFVSRPEISQWLSSQVELVALGIAVDDRLNVRLSEQLIFKENSLLANLAPIAMPTQDARLGLSDKPIVFAAGGPVDAGWGKQLATFLCQGEQGKTRRRSKTKVSADLRSQEEHAYRLLLEGIQACSVVMLTGEKGEPLVGNFLGIAEVPDVSKYLKSLPEVVEIWGELAQQSVDDFKPSYTFATEEIEGKQHCEIVVDIASTARDPNVPMINWMLEAAFGPEGKLSIRLAEVDPTTFAFGFATQQQMDEFLAATRQNKTISPRSPEARVTLDLLKPTSPWKALISPQGCVRWTSRLLNEYWVLLSGNEVTIPAVPDSPPIGLTLDWSDHRCDFEIVCPVATWETLGKYIDSVSSR